MSRLLERARRASTRRASAQGGFTFVELLMTIAVTAMFSVALYGGWLATVEMSRGHESQATAQAEGRTALDRVTRDVRQAVSADAGLTTPIESLRSNELILYVDSRRDASQVEPRPYRVRYRLLGTSLVREQSAPIGASPPFTYAAYAPEEVLVQDVANGGLPIFTALTEQGVAMGTSVYPPFSRDIAQVSVRLRIANTNGNDQTQPTELRTDVALRNVITL